MKKIYLYAVSALALTACAGDEPATPGHEGGEAVEAQISAGLSAPASRADGASWEADEIGITVTSSPRSDMADRYRNMQYVTTSTGATADFTAVGGKIFFQDASETVTFSAYAPFGTWNGGDIISGSTEHQSTREAQKSIDFIYAEGASASRKSPVVSFSGEHEFRHVMSRIEIVVSTSDGFSPDEVRDGSYSLGGLKHEFSFMPLIGAVADVDGIIDDWSLSDNAISNEDGATLIFAAIVPPQSLERSLVFTATVGGQTYVNNSGMTPALESGKSYRYTVSVRKTGISVSGCTISDWNDAGSENIDATMPTLGDKPIEQVARGDFYMADGTLVDGNARLTDKQKSGCVGVVFVDRNPENYGYKATAVALKNAEGNRADALAAGSSYGVKAPLGSSGWFLPDIQTLDYMFWGPNLAIPGTNKKLINEQFAKLGAYAEPLDDCGYWGDDIEYFRYNQVDFSNGDDLIEDPDTNAKYRLVIKF